MSFLALATLLTASAAAEILDAAHRFLPDVRWQSSSVVSADCTCQGNQEVALLGTTAEEIVVAVFLGGTSSEPEVLRYSAKARNAATAKLSIESGGQDLDAPSLPAGMQSQKCQGLRMDDGEVDAAHIYWNPKTRKFADWVR